MIGAASSPGRPDLVRPTHRAGDAPARL